VGKSILLRSYQALSTTSHHALLSRPLCGTLHCYVRCLPWVRLHRRLENLLPIHLLVFSLRGVDVKGKEGPRLPSSLGRG
jgi:hypothetical protein